GIAHEVRNPLNFINLSIDHLRSVHTPKDPAAGSAFTSTIAGIKSEIERLDGIVSNFLNFGRPLKLNLKNLPLEPVIQETLSLMGERCAEQKITVEAANLSPATSITADYRHIKTCLVNIFLNAIQAMPEGGSLRVETTVQAGYASIAVEDTGCGIEPENIPRIFEPYFTTKELGVGIGLALTRRIIEEHGGRIVVRSAPGRGTVVIVNLPVTPVKRPVGAADGSPV
ncbi:MAG: ATP-binding protein, partial [Deltaproteobacteria bacterium]